MKMNMARISVVTSLVLLGSQLGYSQGTFQNLDFENPIQSLEHGVVPITSALPGWTGYLNGNPSNLVWFSNVVISGLAISVVDYSLITFPPIQGLYSVFLNTAGIGQTGQLASAALSLFFLSEPGSGFQVTFGGQGIPLVQFGTSGNNIILAGDISMFAGQTGELRFPLHGRRS